MDLMTLAERSPYVILLVVLMVGMKTLWEELKAERAAHNVTREKANEQIRANDATLRSALTAFEALPGGSK